MEITLREELARTLSFVVNIKRNSHEVARFVDVVYGAFVSVLLYEMGAAFAKIGTSVGLGIDKHLFSFICMCFIMLFVIEDYRGMRVITAICGYYLSAFRFFVDVLIVLLLFMATRFLNVQNEQAAPDRRFILFFALTYFACCFWAILLYKNRREVPSAYTSIILSSHALMGFLWLIVYFATGQKIGTLDMIRPDFPGWSFVWYTFLLFGVYYLMVSWRLRCMKREGLPVDDIIEMYVIKLIRGIFVGARIAWESAERMLKDGKASIEYPGFSAPPSGRRHVVVVVQQKNGNKKNVTLSEYLNEMALHPDLPLRVHLEDVATTPDQELQELSVAPLVTTAAGEEVRYYLTEEN